MKKKNNNKETIQGLSLVTQIGLSVITPILLSVFFGNFIDKKLATKGIFVIIFLILGTGAGFLNLFKITGAYGKKRK